MKDIASAKEKKHNIDKKKGTGNFLREKAACPLSIATTNDDRETISLF